MKKINFILALSMLMAVACQAPKEAAPSLEVIESPAKPNSEEPNLFTDSKGKVYLSWIEKEDKQAKLLFSTLEEGKWSASKLISKGSNWFVNWADFPRLAANNGLIAAHWLQKRAEGTYDYDIQMVMSNDAGKSWGAPFVPHKDGVSAEHGFVSMQPFDDNKIFASWLDGRFTKGEGAGHSEGSHTSDGGAMTVRAAIFDGTGTTINEWELDHRVCDCCQTAAAITSNGPIVVYRDRTEDEIRDMSIVRLVDGQWTEPQIIHSDNWSIAGCPVNGPAIAAKNNLVAVTWFTASGGKPMVKLAISKDAGASFSGPVTVSEDSTNGRVGITLLPDQTIGVSWMETAEETSQVMLGQYGSKGELLKKITVAQTSSSRSSGFPVITSNGNNIYMSWTEVGDTKQVKTTKINL